MNGIPYHDVAEGLYYLAPGGKQLVMLDSTLNQPNGIVALYQQRLFLYHIVYYTFASWMIIVIDATLKPLRLSR